ncbi:hypothetical protein B5G03_00500 [Gemmiger sp. An50]|nr:hypothetical protein B5G03_00500 [Gemmiger sp. An50]
MGLESPRRRSGQRGGWSAGPKAACGTFAPGRWGPRPPSGGGSASGPGGGCTARRFPSRGRFRIGWLELSAWCSQGSHWAAGPSRPKERPACPPCGDRPARTAQSYPAFGGRFVPGLFVLQRLPV